MTRFSRAVLVAAATALVPLAHLAAQDTLQQAVRIGLRYDPGTKPGVLVLRVPGANGDSIRAILQRDFDYGDRINVVAADEAGFPDTPVAGRNGNYPLYARLGAIAALDRAEKLDPESAELLAERAALHARQNQGPQAQAAAERALQLDKGNVEAHRILALVYSAWSEGAGQPPAGTTPDAARAKAIDHLKAIRNTPAMATDLSLQIAYGRLLLRVGETDDAITALEAVVSQAPYLAEPYVLLAEARSSKGEMNEAAEALAQAAEINPRYYVSLGDLYEKLGRWAAAAGAYGQAIEGMRQPSRDLRLRHVTALLNVPGGVGASRAKDALAELLKTTPDDTRLLYLVSMAARQLQDSASGAEA